MADSLGDRVRARDSDVLVGRSGPRAALGAILDADSPLRIAYLHGRAGIGKSALLRELVRRADGYDVLVVDGRELVADVETLNAVVAPLTDLPRPLLVIDTYEDIAALGSHLMQHILPALPSTARIAFGCRTAPDPAWQRAGWGSSMLVLKLDEMSDAESRSLLAARGIRDDSLLHALTEWAAGLPLALSLGATAGAASGPELDLDDLADSLLDHLAGSSLIGADREALAVAAIAPAVDARLLSTVLPDSDGTVAEAWLRSLSFSERLGRRVTLHAHVRRVIASQLRRDEPDYERQLRLRIIEHLGRRAMDGEPQLIGDMRELLEAPEDKGARVTRARSMFRADRVRHGDLEAVLAARQAGGGLDPDWLRRWFEEAPEHVVVFRRRDEIAAYAVWATPHQAPSWAREDPLLSVWLTHAARHAPDGNVLMQLGFGILSDRTRMPDVVALGNVALILRCGLPNLRWWYLAVASDDTRDRARAAEFGARTEPGLSTKVGTVTLDGMAIDFGPRGIIGMTVDRARTSFGGPTSISTTRPSQLSELVVREALRDFHRPLDLAASPLARGVDSTARAESVRRLLRDAVANAFGASADEQLQRNVLEIGYLDSDGGHAKAIHKLHLGRTTYFRRLREATERVTAYLRRL